jgi:transposase
MTQVARLLQRQREHILTYLGHRITNAVTEGLHATIPWITHSARGCRDREACTMPISFHCGGLDLDPRVG